MEDCTDLLYTGYIKNCAVALSLQLNVDFHKSNELSSHPLTDFYLNRKYYSLYKAISWFVKLHQNVLFTVNHTKVK